MRFEALAVNFVDVVFVVLSSFKPIETHLKPSETHVKEIFQVSLLVYVILILGSCGWVISQVCHQMRHTQFAHVDT